MTADPENVVNLSRNRAREQAPLAVVEPDWEECRHARFDVHRDLPRVFCRDCNVELDPFWVLRHIAHEFSNRGYLIDTMKRESAKLEKLLARRLERRRTDRLAESDAREIQRMQQMQRAGDNAFHGDIKQDDK